MRIKKLSVRMLIAVFLGLCAGMVMEYSSLWTVFPVFLVIGVLACIFVEIVIEVIRGTLTFTREDLRKMQKPALRILIATSIGLLAGIILEFASIWAAFPIFFILGVFLGTTFGITIEVIRYRRSMRKAFLEGKGLGMEDLPVSTAELIRLVIKKMRYHKEVRTEVMAELAEHFADELQDCQTDQDKEQKAKQLIAEFGDAKLLAVLLRRAKIRCRPLWRTVVARTFQAAGALILCLIVYAVWFSTGKPTISVDYLALLNQMNRPEVHDEDNAWPHYEKTFELYVKPNGRILRLIDMRRKDFMKKKYFTDLPQDKQDMIRKWLKENESKWDDLELSQRKLFERCFNEGLVPYIYPINPGKSAYKRYVIFDRAVIDIIEKIESYQESGGPNRFSIDYEYGMMMEMEMMGHGHDQGDGRYIKLDPYITLDSEIIALFGSVSQRELTKIKVGIRASVIRRWMDRPPVVVENLLDYLLPFEKKLVVKWVEDNEPAWREFVTSSSKSYCYREFQPQDIEEDSFLWNVGISHYKNIKYLTRLGIWRAQINSQRGNINESIEDYLAIARAGTHWQGRGTIPEQLVGLAFRRMASDEILHILAVKKFPADTLKRIQNQLSQLYLKGYPLMSMEGERIAFEDTIQRLFTKGGPGGGHLIPQKTVLLGNIYDIDDIADEIPVGKKFIENAALTSVCLLHARRDATMAAGNRVYNLAEKITAMSPADRRQSNVDSTEDFFISMPGYRYKLLEYFIPASERISELFYQSKALHHATITILAIQRWHLEKGDYPATLSELIEAGYLKELPIDPYSDKSLIYKKAGDEFILYSIGRNFEDDGGKVFEKDGDVQKWGARGEREGGDAVFWPVQKPKVN